MTDMSDAELGFLADSPKPERWYRLPPQCFVCASSGVRRIAVFAAGMCRAHCSEALLQLNERAK